MRISLLVLCWLLVIHQVASQNLERCYPSKNEISKNVIVEEDKDEVQLDTETVDNYLGFCIPRRKRDQPSERELWRRISEVCELDIDSGYGCEEEAPGPTVRYGYSKKLKTCTKFVYRGCGGNENRFVTQTECAYKCHDPCLLPPDRGTPTTVWQTTAASTEISCKENAGVYYYYNAKEQRCLPLNYLGCEGNRNRFEDVNECMEICAEKEKGSFLANFSMSYKDENSSISEQQRNSEESYCSQFDKQFSDEAEILSLLDLTTSAEIDEMLLNELNSRIDRQPPQSNSAEPTIQNILQFRRAPLKHVTVKIFSRNNCRRINITIRIWCIRGITKRPSDSEKKRLCNLVKSGIKKHWEVDILNKVGTVNYPVTVTVKESFFLSKKVLLKYYTSPPANDRSYNPGWTWFPMVLKYRAYKLPLSEENVIFEYTAAHEFGHDPLMSHGGLVWSWGHEGTSTIFGNLVPSSPTVPANPAKINVMWYYNGDFSMSDYDYIFASQPQMNILIQLAMWRWSYWWCPGGIGAPCFSNSQCTPPGICSWFRCVLCNQDSQCAPDGYCRGIFNLFAVNQCTPKKKNGQWCSRDAMCKSGMCDGFRCVECKVDSDCLTNQYCKYNDIPGVLNDCTPKKLIGQFCLQDHVCQSGFCDGGQCVECEEDQHSPTGQWCKNKNVPGILNDCVNKLGVGALCLNDNQCALGYCDGARCGECEQHYHCPPTRYCKWRNVFGVTNRCTNKKPTGSFCNADIQCLSNNCRWFHLCGP